MPMPTRRRGESESDFIARFMSDPKMREEYPDQDQRLAVASQQVRTKKYAECMTALDAARADLGDCVMKGEPRPAFLTGFVKGEPVTVDMLLDLEGWGGEVGKYACGVLDALENSGELQSGEFNAEIDIAKVSEDQRLVYAWASVIEKDGKPVTDRHGDRISTEELVKGAHRSLRQLVGKQMHEGGPVADIVESLVFTEEVQKALGIDLGLVGWFVGMHVYDDAVWKRVKDGELRALSIAGRGKRLEIVDG